MTFSPADLLKKYYRHAPEAQLILFEHSRLVTRKALSVARKLASCQPVDMQFIAEAAMLHDIGMIFTHAPQLGCYGDLPYLAHGIKGCEILQLEGLPAHARVCERHTGTGLTRQEILAQQLPLPARDMCPESLEEKIICYADLFFSKNPRQRGKEKSPAQVRKEVSKYGRHQGVIFDAWHQQFSANGS
jgi:uncharacterized protein